MEEISLYSKYIKFRSERIFCSRLHSIATFLLAFLLFSVSQLIVSFVAPFFFFVFNLNMFIFELLNRFATIGNLEAMPALCCTPLHLTPFLTMNPHFILTKICKCSSTRCVAVRFSICVDGQQTESDATSAQTPKDANLSRKYV